MSFLRMKDETGMPQDCVRRNRDSLHNCGAPYDYYNLNDLPALESAFDAQLREYGYLNRQAIVYFSGSTVGSERDPDLTAADLKQPGYIVWPEEEDFAHIRRLLNAAGYPMTDKLSPEITAIVEEELSVFAAGVGSAEDCAKKIQSRVSIWLAESG